ncbi:hypothetical protein BCR34DRAFT_489621, partial [Clohesyomyces aquaticus]
FTTLYIMGVSFVKLSVAWFLLRIMQRRSYRRCLYGIIGGDSIHRIKRPTYTAVNIALDVLFATLPIPIIWTLRAGMRTRVSLIMILGLGFTYDSLLPSLV